MKIQKVFFEQLLYTETTISDTLFQDIKKYLHDILNNRQSQIDYNSLLAGNIEKEFYIIDDSIKERIKKYAQQCAYHYEDECFGSVQNQNYDITVWSNFQKKYEFNPVHSHTGDYSFVLWINIPYDLNEELSLKNCKDSNTKCNSLFTFIISGLLGNFAMKRLEVDKSYEGKMILFPSNMAHVVYPFYTSDDYRISIAGNLSKITPQYNKKPSKMRYQ